MGQLLLRIYSPTGGGSSLSYILLVSLPCYYYHYHATEYALSILAPSESRAISYSLLITDNSADPDHRREILDGQCLCGDGEWLGQDCLSAPRLWGWKPGTSGLAYGMARTLWGLSAWETSQLGIAMALARVKVDQRAAILPVRRRTEKRRRVPIYRIRRTIAVPAGGFVANSRGAIEGCITGRRIRFIRSTRIIIIVIIILIGIRRVAVADKIILQVIFNAGASA